MAEVAGYVTACTTHIGHARHTDAMLELNRVPVTGQDTILDFFFRLHTGWRFREWLDGKGRAVARRGATPVRAG